MKKYNFFELNKLLSNILITNNPASILRIDNTSGYVMLKLYEKEEPSRVFFNENTLVEAGVYPKSIDYAIGIYQSTMDIMKTSDVLGFVDISNDILNNNNFLSVFNCENVFGNPAFCVLDPGHLLGIGGYILEDLPWTAYLSGKKVLTISSHHTSINQQKDKLDYIWGNNREKIAPFDFVGNIRSPFHPEIDDRQYGDNFYETVDCIKKEIDKFDFDVLLSSTTHQSPFYVDYAKKIGKIGIQVGGSLQLFFGIIGGRWDMNNCYRNWKNMYNEYWIFPSKEDEPKNIEKIRNLEFSYAYWGKK